jgi:teichuronic acid biosynthesis glycosyltransferase TuaC
MSARKPKVLLFSTLYPSSARPGHGIFVETRLRELLKTGGVEARVVAPVPWFPSTDERFGSYARMARTPPAEVWNDIPVLHPRYPLIPKLGMSSAPFAMAAASLGPLRRLIREGFDFDVIDAHYYYPDGVAAALLAKWIGKPLAITARGTDLNLIPQHALPRRMIRWASMQAHASIGVCSALMDVLRDLGTPADRLHVMRNGVDLVRFQPQQRQASREMLGLVGDPVLLSVGYLIERKGHHLLVQAMPEILKQHPQARLVVVGDGDMRGALQQLACDLCVDHRVTFAGAIAQTELKHWYSAADLFVLASSREGWANVLLESMACGTPVLATAIWGTPEVVASPDAGALVPVRSAEALAHGALQLLQNLPKREAVRAYAEGFDWAATSAAQLKLFSRLAQA